MSDEEDTFVDSLGFCEFCNRHVPDDCPGPGSDPCTIYILDDLADCGVAVSGRAKGEMP